MDTTVKHQPDLRAHLAAERTFLAWIRTGVACPERLQRVGEALGLEGRLVPLLGEGLGNGNCRSSKMIHA